MLSPKADPPTHRSDVDLFSDAALVAPYPHYEALRATGAVVYLEQCEVWALTRYTTVLKALHDWRTFSSTDGIALNDTTNRATGASPLAADPPAHRAPRKVVSRHLSPMAIREQAPEIHARAKILCARLLEQGAFDAVFDVAQPFALSVLADHIGLPADGRAPIAEWADAAFNVMGPENARTEAARVHLGELGIHLLTATGADRLSATGAGRAIYAAGERGDLTMEASAQLIAIYLLASIPTSTAAIGSAIWLFAKHPVQWDALRRNPQLMAQAVDEVLRMESPIQSFSRVVRAQQHIDGVTIPAGARVLLLFGSANRDERVWHHADSFDITRERPAPHLAFSRGLHSCSGQGLARLQVSAVLSALVEHVECWDAGESRWKCNNIIRGLDCFPVAVNRSRPGPLRPPRPRQSGAGTHLTEWRVTGTIGLAKLRQTVELPPDTTFSGAVNMADGTTSGAMALGAVTSTIKLLGITIGSTSQMIPSGPLEGHVTVNPDGTIDMKAVSRIYMHLHALNIGRFRIPLTCRTVRPIEIPLQSQGTMSLDFHPSFSGTMTIPRFRGSGPVGWILSLCVSGPDNPFRISLALPTPAPRRPPALESPASADAHQRGLR